MQAGLPAAGGGVGLNFPLILRGLFEKMVDQQGQIFAALT